MLDGIETNLGSMDETSVVEDCVNCGRIKWTNAACHHGQIPPPSKDAPKENPEKPDPPEVERYDEGHGKAGTRRK